MLHMKDHSLAIIDLITDQVIVRIILHIIITVIIGCCHLISHQIGSQSFRITFGDQTTLVSSQWQHSSPFQNNQLLSGGWCHMDQKFLTSQTNLLTVKRAQNLFQNLWKTKSHFSSNIETRNHLAADHSFF